jgi:outer membrane protein assembly factor BamB/mono/diheme cytochrome c family protein
MNSNSSRWKPLRTQSRRRRAPLRILCMMIVALVTIFFASTLLQASGGSDDGDTRKLASSEWPLVGGDLGDKHYSSLKQINLQNVKELKAVWKSAVLDDGASSRSTPVVKDGRIFFTAGSRIYAISGETGQVLWKYKTDNRPVPGDLLALQRAGFGLPNAQGVGVGDGLVFVGLMDGQVLALRQTDGTVVWGRQVGEDPPPKREGTQVSDAPIYWKGVVYVGMSADYGLRGRINALDAKTGKELWHFFVVPAPGEPGSETWPKDSDVWKRGGGGVWLPGTLDPDLGLVYYATGNAVAQFAGELRPGDNLYTVSVVALDMNTGKLKWHKQLIHHDIWEADIATPLVLFDMDDGGKTRKCLAAMRADGDLFIIDRETGEYVFPVEERPVPQDQFTRTSPTQPFPVGREGLLPDCSTWKGKIPAGFILGCTYSPASVHVPNLLATTFSVRVIPMSYSPATGYFYAQGTSTLSWRRRSDDPYYFGPNGKVPGIRATGILAALDAKSGKIVWKKEFGPSALGRGGALSTAGGLMFRLAEDGNFTAFNAQSGDVLWQWQTGFAGGSGPSSSYELDGQQYVVVSAGPVLWSFKLGGTLSPAEPPHISSAPNDDFAGPIEDTNQVEMVSLQHDIDTTGNRYFIDEYSFNPYRIRVAMTNGQARVTWVNNGRMVHTISALDNSWTTGPLNPAAQGSVTFHRPGRYAYICKDHPWSYGQIIVTEPASTPAASAEKSDGAPASFQLQASRGKEEYDKSCASCHGQDLGGRDPAPALTGETFSTHWIGRTANDLFGKTHSTMPQNKPDSLPRQEYLDIVAFLLKSNGISVGDAGMADNEEALKKIKLAK